MYIIIIIINTVALNMCKRIVNILECYRCGAYTENLQLRARHTFPSLYTYVYRTNVINFKLKVIKMRYCSARQVCGILRIRALKIELGKCGTCEVYIGLVCACACIETRCGEILTSILIASCGEAAARCWLLHT